MIFAVAVCAKSPDSFDRKMIDSVIPYFTSASETTLTTCDSVKLACVFKKGTADCGSIVIVPGKSESWLKYRELAFDLRSSGFSVFMMDLRGMGFSQHFFQDKDAVDVTDFETYSKDLGFFLDSFVTKKQPGPVWIFAHSLGGLVAVRYAEEHPDRVAGLALSSPMIAVNTGVIPKWLANAILAVAKYFGMMKNLAIGQTSWKMLPFRNNPYSHDVNRFEWWQDTILSCQPKIRTGGVTYHWLDEAFICGTNAIADAPKLSMPLLVMRSDKDRVVLMSMIDSIAARAPHAEKIILKGAGHELTQENDSIRNVLVSAVLKFIRNR